MSRILSIILLLIPFLAGAQTAVLKNFNTRNGLPSNEIYFLHHDKKGFIWICSDAGLIKYNGNTFKTFDVSKGMPDNTIFEVKEDKKGRIWYRSFSGKIGYIRNDTVYNIEANKKTEEFIKEGFVCSFAIDNEGNIFVGKRNIDTLSFLKISPPYKPENTSEIWKAKNTEIRMQIVLIDDDLVFSFCGLREKKPNLMLSLFDRHHKELLNHEVDITNEDRTLFTRFFRSGNDIYFVCSKKLLQIDVAKGKITTTQFENRLITAMPADSSTVLLGSWEGGISFLDQKVKGGIPDSLLKGFTFTYVIKDYQNGYWFSTLESGVFYMSANRVHVNHLENSTVQMIRMNDSVLIGVHDSKNKTAKVVAYKLREHKIETLPFSIQIDSGELINIIKRDETSIFVLKSNGSDIVDIHSGTSVPLMKHKPLFNGPRNILQVNTSYLCLAYGELYFINKEGNSPDTTYKSKHRITCGTYDATTGKIYIGTLRGLYQFNNADISEKDCIIKSRIADLACVHGRLFIATNGSGLIIKTGNRSDTLNERNGFIGNICKSVTVSDNSIWISTNKGFSKIVFNEKDDINIHNYPLSGFIDVASATKITLLKNKVCFFDDSKLYSFNETAAFNENRLYVSSMNVNGKSFDIESPIVLDYKQSNIRIDYEALFYNNSNITYRYKIKKDEAHWNLTNEAGINLPSLSPGDYEFSVEAKNNQGEWVKADKKIIFTIEKPFWQRAWFISLEILAAAALIVLALRYRYLKILKKERSENELKINMYELETKAVKAQMNPHFIFNSLNSIQQFILGGDNENAYRYLAKFSKLVRKLLESNTSDTITLEDETDLLKRYIEIEALRFESVFNYEIEVDERLNSSAVEIPHLLVQPFVENAIWHGLLHKKGDKKLKVSFFYINEKCLNCVIEDNGVGRSFKKPGIVILKTKQSLAIEFIKQRLELLRKTKNIDCGFEFIDKKDEQGNSTGTIVTITIPILTPNESKSNHH